MLDYFRDSLGLREQKEIIPASALGIRPAHIEAAKWMHPYQSSGTFAVVVEIPDVTFIFQALDIFPVIAVGRTCQPVFAIVRNLNGLIQNFLLFDRIFSIGDA